MLTHLRPRLFERADNLLFDFKRFSKVAANVYEKVVATGDDWYPYSLTDCLEVFRLYFRTYEEYMGHPHPPIRASQIARIMQHMPWIDDIGIALRLDCADILAEEYNYIIPLHFKTSYRNCDYNINHFFAGRIRELRLHEADAGRE